MDRQSYRLFRYEQQSGYPTAVAYDHADAVVLYPPDGPLRDCPTTPTVSIEALQSLAAAVP